jgi:nitrogen fixation protein FixH
VSPWAKLSIGILVGSILAVIGVTVVVGSKVREETVVERPYEEGLHHDAERHARAALGLGVALEDGALAAGATPLAFRLADGHGQPFSGARVTVEVSLPDTSRGEVRAEAREVAPGRYAADVALPAAGPWDVRFDVVHGADRVRLEKRVVAVAPCDLGQGPCTRPLPDGAQVTLDLGPRPLRTMQDLSVRASVAWPAHPERARESTASPVDLAVAFSMPGMEMGQNRARLRTTPDGWQGTAVLVRCPSGRKGWIAEVTVSVRDASPETVRFPLTVVE